MIIVLAIADNILGFYFWSIGQHFRFIVLVISDILGFNFLVNSKNISAYSFGLFEKHFWFIVLANSDNIFCLYKFFTFSY